MLAGIETRHTLLQCTRRIIDTVIQLVPPNRLLRYRIRAGWEPLCRFLGAPEPDEPFPRRNQRAEFLASAPEWAKRLMEAAEEREEPTGGLGDEGRGPQGG
ncbi:MAG: sulfotransferase [Anaerolineales bacterium]